MTFNLVVGATLAVLVAVTTASRFGQLKSSLTKNGQTTPFVDVGPQNVKEDAYYMWQCMMASMAEYKVQKEASEVAAEMGLSNKADQNYVCYTDLGCFYKNGTLSSMNKLPHNTKTVFYLWTFADQQNPQVLDWKKPATISNSLFRADRPTVVMIHGFANDVNTVWVPDIKAAVFRGHPRGVNFIYVDWGRGASGPDYWQAASNTQVAGAQVAKLICTINNVKHTRSSSFQLIGFSLGAHVSGFTGYRLATYGDARVGKITALDPAGPMFENVHPDARLSPDDADFVQAFHVNGATLTFGGFGLYSRVGHIDFYPNGGRYQPGCPHAIIGAIGDLWNFNFTNMPDSVACNHGRAIDLGVASVDQNCVFASHACSNHSDYRDAKCFTQQKGTMGLFANNVASDDQQFLITRGTSGRFCGRVVKMTFKFTLLQLPTSGSFFLTLVDKFGNEENVGQIVKDESMPPGGALMRVILSEAKVGDLVAAKIRYEPERGILWDSSDTVKVNSIRLTSQESDKGEVCGLYQLLTKGETVTFDLTSRNCRSIWAKK